MEGEAYRKLVTVFLHREAEAALRAFLDVAVCGLLPIMAFAMVAMVILCLFGRVNHSNS